MIAGVLPRLLEAMADLQEDLVIVLDDFHVLQDVACHTQVEFLVEHLPARAHLVILTRADPGLRVAWLRAVGRLAEIRAADLAFTAEETSSLLAVEHVQVSSGSVRDLVQRTEGWPAGLYLATLSMSGRSDPDEFVREISDGNRFIGDYLTEEVLAGHSDEVREFIRTMSILDRFSAPLADFMTGATNSAALLHELERTNLFLIPLDESRSWFRFHHLFASAARSELELADPERVPRLHAAAARWFREHGHVDEAVMHSLASGSTSDASELVQASWLNYVGSGRAATVVGWLDSLGPSAIDGDPAARVTAAWMAALSGDQSALAEHLAGLEEVKELGPLPDGTRTVESAIGMIQGLFGYGGPAEMTSGAQRALELETDGRSPYYSVAHLARGHAAYVEGDLDLAVNLLAKAVAQRGRPSDHPDTGPVLPVAGRGRVRPPGAQPWAGRGCHAGRRFGWAAGNAAGIPGLHGTGPGPGRGRRDDSGRGHDRTRTGAAQEEPGPRALGGAPPRPGGGPGGHRGRRARGGEAAGRRGVGPDGCLSRGDGAHAGETARDRRRDLARRPLPQRTTEPLGHEVLTDRELEVLRLLQGSLSLSEIAGELYISPNTVKTHAKAVYRKLGVSSRTEAVRVARGSQLV